MLQQAEKNKDSATQKKLSESRRSRQKNLQTMMMRSSADYRNQSKSPWKRGDRADRDAVRLPVTQKWRTSVRGFHTDPAHRQERAVPC